MVTGRVAFFIDGFNLYHALHHAPTPYTHTAFRKYKWLDLAKLCRILIPRKCTITKIYYIAIKLVQAGLNGLFDTAVIVSGDTDLVPAVQGVQQLFPTKQIGFVFPMGRTSNEIRQIANFTMRLSERHVSTCQFPDTIQLSGGVTIERPDNWR